MLNSVEHCYGSEMVALISKKDLLKETGISYGQLYRWKREGIIPEEWFMKQSTFTGQETFFPKKRILNRIKAVMELKDRYTLEELAKMLSPEVSERIFIKEDLEIIEEIDNDLIPIFCKAFAKDNFTFIEVLVLTVIAEFSQNHNLKSSEVFGLSRGIKDHLSHLRQTDYLCFLLLFENTYFLSVEDEQKPALIDKRLEKIAKVNLNDISTKMRIKYRKSFNFKFDDTDKVLKTDFDSEKDREEAKK